MAPITSKPKVYIQFIRHAQSEGNYNAKRLTATHDPGKPSPSEIARCKSLIDPPLTPHGINEALDLRHRFPFMSKITHILTSPLRRTLQTTLIALEPAIRRNGVRIVAMDLLRETGKSANSWGSHVADLVEELRGLGGGGVVEGMEWEVEEWWERSPCPVGLEKRVEMVRFRLGDLGRVARMGEGERVRERENLVEGGWKVEMGVQEGRWLMEHDVPVVEGEGDVHVAVVSHGSFLRRLIGADKGDGFRNAEYRTFVVEDYGDGDEEKVERRNGMDRRYELVETRESYMRSFVSTSEKAIEERTRAREAEVLRIALIEMAKEAMMRLEEIEKEGTDVMEIEGVQEAMVLS